MRLDSFFYTDRGGRERNEDCAALLEQDGHGIYVVADGLGGHQHGEKASACVRDSLLDGWEAETGKDRAAELNERILSANRALLEVQKEQHCTMRSTVAALAIDEERAVWAHVGDSRLYYLQGNMIRHITEDHSVSYKKYKAGEISRTQIGQDEDQSRLLRTLGNEERFEPVIHIAEEPLAPDDAFLLCSDGVWEYLYDEEVLIDYLKADTAEEWGRLLLLRILKRLGPENDNLTLMTVVVK